MASGYVYVLVNSSMPGLVKVGKTTRDPAERTQELSGVTGVPTPFVLAFDNYFTDCDAAEQYVHEELQRRGFRETNNREFFRAAPGEIIKIVLNAPGSTSRSATVEDNEDSDILGNQLRPEDELDAMQFSRSNPWDGIIELAESNYLGLDDFLQDYGEALKLYRQAARLGSIFAYEQLGKMHLQGEGTIEDREKSLSFFKEGARKGNYYCYSEMAALFFYADNIVNSLKCWEKFFSCRELGILPEVENYHKKFVRTCANYVDEMLCSDREVTHFDVLRPLGSELQAYMKRVVDNPKFAGPYAEAMLAASQWVERELLP